MTGPRGGADLSAEAQRAKAEATKQTRAQELPRRAFCEDALQGAAMHVQPPRGFGDGTVAHLVDAMDVLPAHTIRRHRIVRQLGLHSAAGTQSIDTIIRLCTDSGAISH